MRLLQKKINGEQLNLENKLELMDFENKSNPTGGLLNSVAIHCASEAESSPSLCYGDGQSNGYLHS